MLSPGSNVLLLSRTLLDKTGLSGSQLLELLSSTSPGAPLLIMSSWSLLVCCLMMVTSNTSLSATMAWYSCSCTARIGILALCSEKTIGLSAVFSGKSDQLQLTGSDWAGPQIT